MIIWFDRRSTKAGIDVVGLLVANSNRCNVVLADNCTLVKICRTTGRPGFRVNSFGTGGSVGMESPPHSRKGVRLPENVLN